MNTYEFIKKGYGEEDIRHLNLYISIISNGKEYQVRRLDKLEILLTEHFIDGTSTHRYLGKNSNLRVIRLSREPTNRLVQTPKTTLYIGRD